MTTSSVRSSWTARAAVIGVAVASLGVATLTTIEPAQAQHFGGRVFVPGGHFGGGYGGWRGGYGGWRGGGYHRYGYGLGGFGVGLALGSGLGYGYGYPGYGYGGYGSGYSGAYYGGYNGCMRRAWGPYGRRWVNACY